MKKLLFVLAVIAGLNVSGQCYPDRHNTSWNEGWISCTMRPNPNTIRGNSHWIMYDFGHKYKVQNIKMWNVNDPQRLDDGFRQVAIDYSEDGATWTHLNTYTLEKASGTSIYEGQNLGSFGGDTARYVIITGLTNWGGDCSGIAEVQIETLGASVNPFATVMNQCMTVSIYPNPHTDAFNINITSTCTGAITWQIYNSLGQKLTNGNLGSEITTLTQSIPTNQLAPGIYHIILKQGGNVGRYTIMKMGQ